jgi:hypothetical protein
VAVKVSTPALLDNFLFVIKITPDDLISVVKYEIIDE